MKKFLLLFLCVIQFSCTGQAIKKFNGVSFVASREAATQNDVAKIMDINANSAAVMPFGFIREIGDPKIIFDTDRQWYGETKTGAKQYIEQLHNSKISVMLKPQIWISRGVFTGTLKMEQEKQWLQLEDSYRGFILSFAKLAEETNVELFSIGTELEQFILNRPEYWKSLITEIRKIYSGKLTYAANWDEFERVPFWSRLDYIGIDAYFPLSDQRTPTVAELKVGWEPWKSKITNLAKTTSKPVLFTEFGYRSMDYTAKKPWLVDRTEEVPNMDSQVNAKKAIFSEFWGEPWFAGGFVWKWFIDHDRAGGAKDNRFTPQNKPSLQIISEYYKIYADK